MREKDLLKNWLFSTCCLIIFLILNLGLLSCSLQPKQQSQQEGLFQAFAKNPAVLIGASPVVGATDQKIVLLEFSDFQCSYCASVQSSLKQFMTRHGDSVTLVFKHLPIIEMHPEALPAAQASWAAQQQGKFWEYHDSLFAQQEQLGEELYIAIAKELKLNLDQFNQDRRKGLREIAIDLKLAQSLDIQATPFFLLNDIPLRGAVPLEKFEAALAQAKASLIP